MMDGWEKWLSSRRLASMNRVLDEVDRELSTEEKVDILAGKCCPPSMVRLKDFCEAEDSYARAGRERPYCIKCWSKYFREVQGNDTSSVSRLAGDGDCHLPLKGKALEEAEA